MRASTLAPSATSADVAVKLLRVEVLQNVQGSPGGPTETSTRRSSSPPPPLRKALQQIPEGPVQPALRRFRGSEIHAGGPMPPPK